MLLPRQPRRRPILLLLALLLCSSPALATTYVVNSTGTTADAILGDQDCDDGSGECTLHAAIAEANQDLEEDTIEFDIPGTGIHSISLDGAPLPLITSILSIDGFSQPGAQANTLAQGSNAIWRIHLVGNGTEALGVDVGDTGCLLTASRCRIQGLQLRDFAEAAIRIGHPGRIDVVGNYIAQNLRHGVLVAGDFNVIGGAASEHRNVIVENGTFTNGAGVSIRGVENSVYNNYIGIGSNGTLPLGNAIGVELTNTGGNDNLIVANVISSNDGPAVLIKGSRNTLLGNLIGVDASGTLGRQNLEGVRIENIFGPGSGFGLGNVIGGTGDGDGNVIARSLGDGITISDGEGNVIIGNTVGFFGRGNQGYGISVAGEGNQIGGANPNEGNQIAYNGFGGVTISGEGNAIRGNRIFGHRPNDANVIGIDLGGDGVTLNDPGDGDTGANEQQNYPVIVAVDRTTTLTRIEGLIETTPSADFVLDFFSTSRCDASDHGEGEFFLGSLDITMGIAPTPFTFDFAGAPGGAGFSATMTDVLGNTSEFSECFAVDTSADANLALSVVPESVTDFAGATIGYAVRLRNFGPAEATNIRVGHATGAAIASHSGVPDAGSFDGSEWTIPSLASGGTIDLTMTAGIDLAAEGSYPLDAHVEGADQVDTDLSNNDAALALDVINGVQLVLSHSVDDIGPDPGQIIDFTLTVRNDGPVDAVGVVATGLLPPGQLEFVDGPFGFNLDAASGGWLHALGAIGSGAQVSFVIEARVTAGAALGSAIQHIAVVPRVDLRDDLSNNLRTVELGVGGAADLALELVANVVDPEIDEDDISYVLHFNVRNNGPDAIAEINLNIQYPSCFFRDQTHAAPLPGQALRIVVIDRIQTADVFDCSWIPRLVDRELYDPVPANDRIVAIPPPLTLAEIFDCGLGFELVVLLPGLMWLRGRMRRRRGSRARAGASGGLLVILLAVVAWSAGSARAMPVTFVVDAPGSALSVQTTSPYTSDTQQTEVTGAGMLDVVLTDHALFGTVVTQLGAGTVDLGFSNITLTLDTPAGVAITVSGSGLGGSLAVPVRPGFAAGVDTSLVDFAGSVLALDAGLLLASGSVLGDTFDAEFDLVNTPLEIALGLNTLGTVAAVANGSNVDLALSLPLSLDWELFNVGHQSVFFPSGFDVAIALDGQIDLTGTAIVPEPGVARLLALGLVLIGSGRRAAAGRDFRPRLRSLRQQVSLQTIGVEGRPPRGQAGGSTPAAGRSSGSLGIEPARDDGHLDDLDLMRGVERKS